MCVYADRFDSVVVLCVCVGDRTKKDENDQYYVLQCVYTLADGTAGRPRQIFWQFLPPKTKIKTFSFLSSQVNSFHAVPFAAAAVPRRPVLATDRDNPRGRILIFCRKFGTARDKHE